MSPRATRARTTVWLLCLAVVQAGLATLVVRAFVFTTPGQWTETAALQGNAIGRDEVAHAVDAVLDPISVLSVGVAIATVTFIAMVRRRFALAVAASALVIGANVATQVLKQLIDRPDLGVDAPARMANSLPSGHTTVAASVVLALVLVLPPRMRGFAALVGAGYAALTGAATLAAGWHRPSDVVVSYLVVGAWAALISLPLVLRRASVRRTRRERGHRLVVVALTLSGLILLTYGALALRVAYGLTPPDYTHRLLLAAYVGGAVTIAGTACVMVAAPLAAVHRIVPTRLPGPRRPVTRVPEPRVPTSPSAITPPPSLPASR